MHSGYSIVLTAIAHLVVAQETPDYPRCSVPCLRELVPEIGCSLPDTACQCGSSRQDALRRLLQPCVASACNADARMRLWTTMNETCASYHEATSSGRVSISSSSYSIPWSIESASLEHSTTTTTTTSMTQAATSVDGGVRSLTSGVVASEPPATATDAPDDNDDNDDDPPWEPEPEMEDDEIDHIEGSAPAVAPVAATVTAIALCMGVVLSL